MVSHILVIGATGKQLPSCYYSRIMHTNHTVVQGPTGVEFCCEAIKEGHRLALYVRNPDKLPTDISSHDGVTVIKGNLEDTAGLERAISSGPTVFVSFAGPVANSKGTVCCTLTQ